MKRINLLLVFCLTLMATTATTVAQAVGDGDQTGKAGSISGAVIGGVAVLALAVIVIFMVRNRRKTIGGIQDQSKPAPTPMTTQSIDNPGAGV